MSKKILFTLYGIFLASIISLSMLGCGSVTTSNSGTLTEIQKQLKDPGVITNEAVTISGSVKYSGGTVDVNLNSIIVSGEAITLDSSRFAIYVGKAGAATSEWTSVNFSLVDVTVSSLATRPMDLVFIMDNTGSMTDVIKSVKDSISAFAISLEAAGTDVRFGIVSFGDDTSEASSLDLPATAEAVAGWLNALQGVSGSDAPENPLDSIVYAYRNFSWRSGAQKVFIVITDAPCHQVNDGGQGGASSNDITSFDISSVQAILVGNASIYAVSPSSEGYKALKDQPSSVRNGDIRDLADGLGYTFATNEAGNYTATKRTTTVPNTGGKWIPLPESGTIDLNELGISASVTKGYTLRFNYTFEAGLWYIHILADTNKDSLLDSDVVIPLTVSPSECSILQVKPSSPPPVPHPRRQNTQQDLKNLIKQF